jgi:hypothetical protein
VRAAYYEQLRQSTNLFRHVGYVILKNPLILIAAFSIVVAPAFAAFRPSVEKLPAPAAEDENSPLSSGLIFAQAQAPGRPLTADEQRRVQAPQPPARDPLVRTGAKIASQRMVRERGWYLN